MQMPLGAPLMIVAVPHGICTYCLCLFGMSCLYDCLVMCDYLIRNEKRSTFFNAMPAPFATECNGSSAIWNGILNLSSRRLLRPRSMAPPPVSQMPLVTMSAYSSGGVFSRAVRTAFSIFAMVLSIHSAISFVAYLDFQVAALLCGPVRG